MAVAISAPKRARDFTNSEAVAIMEAVEPIVKETAHAGAVVPAQPNMMFSLDKGERHGATMFTKESIFLFFWDGHQNQRSKSKHT